VRSFVQAYDAGHRFEAVVFSEVLNKSPLVEMIVRRLKASGVRPVRVSPEQFRSVSTTQRASGIGAIVREQWTRLDDALAEGFGLGWIVIEHIRSPGNLGTILRTAEACGMGAAIFLGNECDPFHPTVVRASMGGLGRLRVVRTNHARFAAVRRRAGLQVVGLSPDADLMWTELPADLPLGRPTAIVIGEERQGLSQEMRAACDLRVRLPMSGTADSLNAGVAAGIMMYELVRRQLAPSIGSSIKP
jgi:TrmH family RNA methyltransferase